MIGNILAKTRNRLEHDGIGAMLARGGYHLRGSVAGALELRRRQQFGSLEELLDYANTAAGGYFRPLQVRSEILRLLAMVRELRPRRVMEIGTASGGTLLMWTRVSAPDARFISLDLPDGPWGGGYGAWKSPLYKLFALPGQRVDLIRADSHQPESKQRIESLLNGEKLDFLMIDGDHSYQGVRQDFEMYGPLVRSGGLVAFHDVSEVDPKHQCDVRRFWLELTERYPEHYEFIDNPTQGWGGIGAIRQS